MNDEPPMSHDAQELFDLAPCGLLVTREDGTILQVNETFSRWLGYTEEELRGRRFQDLLTMGGRIFHQTHWAPLIQMQGSVSEVKLDLLHSDRHEVTMLLNAVRRENPNGAYHQLALIITTDRDKFEQELISARKLAEDALRRKTVADLALQNAQDKLNVAYEKAQRRAQFAEQMVAIVSHDLKNPLTAIKMAAEMLARSEKTPKELKLLGHVSHSVERAQRMIADLLDFALVRVGRGIAINPVALDLHEVTGRCVAELRVAFPQAVLEHCSSGSGAVILDADRVHQIIGNLVANSVAYGDLQQPILVTTAQQDEEAIISVHNHGAAIPEHLIDGLFQPMTRGTETDDNLRSVGLGLFIVKEITLAHGGTVSVDSALDAGTTFRICFPSQPHSLKAVAEERLDAVPGIS